MTGSDLARVLTMLEEGRREEARTLLAEHFDDVSWRDPDRRHRSLDERLAYRIHLTLTTREPPPEAGEDEHSPAGTRAAIRAMDHILRASAALRSGRLDELVASTRAARDLAPRSMPWIVFLVGSRLQACYRFTGEPSLRREALDVCEWVADRVHLPHLAVQARALLGNIHMMHGALHRALEHFDAALALARDAGLEARPEMAMAHQFRGYVFFEWNRTKEAEAELRRAWSLSPPGAKGVRSGVARMMARARSAAGDRAGAEEWLDKLEEVMAGPLTLRNREWLTATRLRSTSGPGNLRAVERWARRWNYDRIARDTPDRRAILARLHELDQALALLEATAQWSRILELAPVVAEAAGEERRWFAARARSTEAVALEAKGRRREADDAFREALALGDEGSFVRAYVEGHRLRQELLARAADGANGAIGEERAGGARRRRDERNEAKSGDPRAARVIEAAPELVGGGSTTPLTPRQIEVLEQVAAGASNETVARRLGISVSTVKTHLRAVFSRLEVSSRTQAVARARERGLLS